MKTHFVEKVKVGCVPIGWKTVNRCKRFVEERKKKSYENAEMKEKLPNRSLLNVHNYNN